MYCPNCGSQVEEDQLYCPNCGINLKGTKNYSSGNNQNNEDKPIKGGALGFVLTFFIGLIGFILCLILGDEPCRKAAITTLIVSIVIGVFVGIIYASFILSEIF